MKIISRYEIGDIVKETPTSRCIEEGYALDDSVFHYLITDVVDVKHHVEYISTIHYISICLETGEIMSGVFQGIDYWQYEKVS